MSQQAESLAALDLARIRWAGLAGRERGDRQAAGPAFVFLPDSPSTVACGTRCSTRSPRAGTRSRSTFPATAARPHCRRAGSCLWSTPSMTRFSRRASRRRSSSATRSAARSPPSTRPSVRRPESSALTRRFASSRSPTSCGRSARSSQVPGSTRRGRSSGRAGGWIASPKSSGAASTSAPLASSSSRTSPTCSSGRSTRSSAGVTKGLVSSVAPDAVSRAAERAGRSRGAGLPRGTRAAGRGGRLVRRASLPACVRPRPLRASPGYGGWVTGEHVLDVAGREITITSPEKVFFSERGETKLDLVRYYLAVAEPHLRTAGGRPTLMQRFPGGAEGSSFFQKRVPENAPEWLQTTIVSTPNGTTSRALVLADMAHVLWAVNLACLGFHVWPYPYDLPEIVDELRLDLDPQPGVGFDGVRAAAAEVGRLLDELGSRAIRRPPATGGSTSTCASSRAGRLPGAVRSGRRRARARTPQPGADHGCMVEGGARPPCLRRLQPERAAQDGFRGLVGTPAGRRPGFGTAHLGRGRDCPPRRARRSRPCRSGWPPRAIPGSASASGRSRSSRCSSCTNGTGPPACWTLRGRPSTRSSRTSRRGSLRAAPVRTRPSGRVLRSRVQGQSRVASRAAMAGGIPAPRRGPRPGSVA